MLLSPQRGPCEHNGNFFPLFTLSGAAKHRVRLYFDGHAEVACRRTGITRRTLPAQSNLLPITHSGRNAHGHRRSIRRQAHGGALRRIPERQARGGVYVPPRPWAARSAEAASLEAVGEHVL